MGRASFHTKGMKANPRDRARSVFPSLLVIGALSTAMLAGCVPPPPSATPAPTLTAAPAPRPTRPTPPPAPPVADWRDAPQSPGSWGYASNGSASGATFGGGQFIVQCDAARTVTLVRGGSPRAGQVAISITTATGSRSLTGTATPRGIVTTLPARDSVLDAMAFSRGRFAVAVTGEPTLYLPSWTEISRVIEDCR